MNKSNVSIRPIARGTEAKAILSEQDLARIARLIYQRSGIVLSSQKHDMVYNRLARRLQAVNIGKFKDYINLLENDAYSAEWQPFINALTTNLTSFFREAYHFPILAGHARARRGNYTVWSTAASTGEEPCSIAMTLHEVLGPSHSGSRVWATDIDTEVLTKASKGIYRLSDIDNLSQEQKHAYLLRGTGEQASQVKIKKEILSAIHYQQLNLLSAVWDVPAPFDAIFCRNVMIYFDAKTQETLLQRFAKLLKPGGYLFLGHSEHFGQINHNFQLKGQAVYCLKQEG